MENQNEQPSVLAPLPYAPIPERTYTIEELRKNLKRTGTDILKCPLNILEERPGFNWREKPDYMSEEEWEDELEIPELAAGILANNLQTAVLEVDYIISTNKCLLLDGHRRCRAFKKLYRDGIIPADFLINVIVVGKEMTELDRMKRVITSQNNLQLSPMQLARGYKRLKDNFGLTSTDIARIYGSDQAAKGRSRQWVDNMLHLNNLSPEDQKRVEREELAVTDALAMLREKRKEEKEAKKPAVELPPPPPAGSETPAPPPGDQKKEDNDQKKEDNKGDLEPENENKSSEPGNKEPEDQDDDDDDQKGEDKDKDNASRALEPHVPLQYDKHSVHGQEASLNRGTDPNFRDPRSKNDGEDALGEIDFKKDKTEAEMDLNECTKLLDKIEVQMGTVAPFQRQWANDIVRMISFIRAKHENVQKIIKKAADKR